MRLGRQVILIMWVIPVAVLTGCASRGVTSLADGFKSYDSGAVVRERLNQAGLSGRWHEQRTSTASSDQRPPYQFLTMSGPYSLLGVDGDLKLVFYNERLMTTEFSTLHGRELIAALRKHDARVPLKVGDEVTIDRRTRLLYAVDANGVFHFTWRDGKLEDEWSNWVRNNS
jgi:hypothetical protein